MKLKIKNYANEAKKKYQNVMLEYDDLLEGKNS